MLQKFSNMGQLQHMSVEYMSLKNPKPLNSDSQKIKGLVVIHNHGSRKTKGINQRNLDPESPPFL
jgi:hypothetical protein